MEEFAKKKGKEATRGSKQIVKENAETIQFYRNIILGSNGMYFLIMTLLGPRYGYTEILCFLLSASLCISGYQFFSYFGSPTLAENGSVLDTGIDLNITSGVSEHVKDLIILVGFAQVLSLFSNYFWLLLLLIPARGFWMLWKSVIAPWLFAPAPEEDTSAGPESKKTKKMERKMKRMQVR
uniref:Transmembrane protein 208 n=1 Tax=Caligus clemensi TaxID=344056 RepID=C1C182_CALCM|nr:Transmembrane protein 208 [Caligus clemensi]